MKLSADIELFDLDVLEGYANLCGWSGARPRQAGGKAIEIAAYMGRSDRFVEALLKYAASYADRSSAITTPLPPRAAQGGWRRTDEDMIADFRV